MESSDSRPVLLVGLPRSGTTWLAGLLSRPDPGVQIYEPDNEKIDPLAWYSKRGLHRYPFLEEGDPAPSFGALWRLVLSGAYPRSSLFYRGLQQWFRRATGASVEAHIGMKTGLTYVDEGWNRVRKGTRPYAAGDHPFVVRVARRYLSHAGSGEPAPMTVVKSVHAPLALDWIGAAFDVRIVLLLRNPFGLYTSYLRQGYPDGNRNVLAQAGLRRRLEEGGWSRRGARSVPPDHAVALEVLTVYRLLATQMRDHPDWIVCSHDRLCANPAGELGRVLPRMPGPWSGRPVSDFLGAGGDGRRRRRQPVKWKAEMTREEHDRLRRNIRVFGLEPFLSEHVYSPELDYSVA